MATASSCVASTTSVRAAALILLAAGMAQADVIAHYTDASGTIELHDTICAVDGHLPHAVATLEAAAGKTFHGAWRTQHGLVLFTWEDGDRGAVRQTSFKRGPRPTV
jgi:hypothetical protein